jgi:glycosyltransferase involved in cell wall biosynthesis
MKLHYPNPRISVIMPTYKQAAFILRAVKSLQLQSFSDWELLIINDGSPDDTEKVLQNHVSDSRIKYFRNAGNKGLGACLNQGIGLSQSALIAYLPSDDIYFKDHLQSLYDSLQSSENAILACSGVRHHSRTTFFGDAAQTTTGKISGIPMQLVQVLHKRTDDTWMEREELTTNDLDRMFWHKLLKRGDVCHTEAATCEWVDHPDQRHKIISESHEGGIYKYKKYYQVAHPVRFQSSIGNYIDEVERYRPFRDRPEVENNAKLRILLVGELSYNPERIVALEERGHKLYGLWVENPDYFNSVGPLSFGRVETIPYKNWLKHVERIKPDIIYALLNSRAVPFAHQILLQNPGIPFVWHFKEGPILSRQFGEWQQLVDLYSRSDGQIYINEEARDWFAQFLHGPSDLSLILDGDLPKNDCLLQNCTPLLSKKDGEIHTVVPGRPMGVTLQILEELTRHNIHFHFYGDVHQGMLKNWVSDAHKLAGRYFHIHPNCTQENWVSEFSQYDAGFLHLFKSKNEGELMKIDWNDLNLPSRMATLGVAGVPTMQVDNSGHIVASQSLIRQHGIGYFLTTGQVLKQQLSDRNNALLIREKAWEKREIFTFDYHADRLIDFFRDVIDKKTVRHRQTILKTSDT